MVTEGVIQVPSQTVFGPIGVYIRKPFAIELMVILWQSNVSSWKIPTQKCLIAGKIKELIGDFPLPRVITIWFIS
jgi:hypothetical protein